MHEYKNRILVVDDDTFMCSLLESVLSERYEVVTAASGEEALQRLSEMVRVDLIILDVRMPGMDGYELMERIQEIPLCTDIPVVYLTSETGPDAEIRGLRTGVADYIQKPFRQDALLARVETRLRAGRRLDMEKLKELPEKLTDTELELLQLAALSYSNEEIADRMGYAYGYTRQMMSKLMQKIGMENRRDARRFL